MEKSITVKDTDVILTVDADLNYILAKYKKLNDSKKAIDKELKELSPIIKEKMKGYTIAVNENEEALARYSIYTKNAFDSKKFQLENPDTYQKYVVTKEESRLEVF